VGIGIHGQTERVPRPSGREVIAGFALFDDDEASIDGDRRVPLGFELRDQLVLVPVGIARHRVAFGSRDVAPLPHRQSSQVKLTFEARPSRPATPPSAARPPVPAAPSVTDGRSSAVASARQNKAPMLEPPGPAAPEPPAPAAWPAPPRPPGKPPVPGSPPGPPGPPPPPIAPMPPSPPSPLVKREPGIAKVESTAKSPKVLPPAWPP